MVDQATRASTLISEWVVVGDICKVRHNMENYSSRIVHHVAPKITNTLCFQVLIEFQTLVILGVGFAGLDFGLCDKSAVARAWGTTHTQI